MQKITPHLWFDTQAREAGEFYASLFDGGKVTSVTTLHGTPSGSVDLVDIEIAGLRFQMISAGPLFKFNPSISFLVSCPSKDDVDKLWRALSEGGKALMELGAYPFSEHYGWLEDRYGLSWQLMVTNGVEKQRITPVMMFTGAQAGRAEEAIRFYASLFPESNVGQIMRDAEGTIQYGQFELAGQSFAAMDSAHPHGFAFNEAVSLMVHCETQQEIDKYWESLSADPRAEACGWLKDRFGVSWQVVPTAMERMLASGDNAGIARVTEAFLKMKKFDIAALETAFAS